MIFTEEERKRLFHCWHCGKSLLEREVADGDFVTPPFHCSKMCQSKCVRWNSKPKDHDGYGKSSSGAVAEVEEIYSRSPDLTYKCSHKYNCRAHREICMEKYGYDSL